MLTKDERDLIFKHAYVPEHLPDYVQSVSLAEPHIHQGCLCFIRDAVLIFVGYGLEKGPADTGDISELLKSACERFQPSIVRVISPCMNTDMQSVAHQTDNYYRLELPLVAVRAEDAYMMRRANRELCVEEGTFSPAHDELIETFISERDLTADHQEIFRSLRRYFENSRSARLLEARKEGKLVAFTVLDLGSAEYAFYLFNLRSRSLHVPGTSDLLFYEMTRRAEKEGKRYLNLGLGVNPGVRRFKTKWGATPFLSYHAATIHRKRPGLLDIIKGILNLSRGD